MARMMHPQTIRCLGGASFVAGVALVYATTLLASRIGYQASQDSHYHFAIAREIVAGNFRSELAMRLPWTVLANMPVDHAFGYHLVLSPFALAEDPEIGMKLGTVTMFAGVFLAMYAFLRAHAVAYAAIWALLPGLFSNQDWRYLMLRGGHWMVILSLAYLHVAFFVRRPWLRRCGIVALAYVAMLSYQGALVLLPMHLGGTCLLWLLQRRELARGESFEPLLALVGFSLGLTLNPYMDQQASTWRFAWFHVMFMLRDPAKLYADLREFGPLPPEMLKQNPEFIVLAAAVLGAFGLVVVRAHRQRTVGRASCVLAGVAIAGILMTVRAIRMREYAVPWAFLFLASLAPKHYGVNSLRNAFGVACGALTALGFYLKWPDTHRQLGQHLPTYQYRNASELLQQYKGRPVLNVAEGDYTTLRWEYPDVVCVQGLSRYFLYPNRPIFDDVWALRDTSSDVERLQILRRFYERGVRLLAVQHRNSVFQFAEAHPAALRLGYRSEFGGGVKITGSSIYVLNASGIDDELRDTALRSAQR